MLPSIGKYVLPVRINQTDLTSVGLAHPDNIFVPASLSASLSPEQKKEMIEEFQKYRDARRIILNPDLITTDEERDIFINNNIRRLNDHKELLSHLVTSNILSNNTTAINKIKDSLLEVDSMIRSLVNASRNIKTNDV